MFEFFSVAWRALTFGDTTEVLLTPSRGENTLITLIVVLAGFSEALGQSVVLFASRVKKRRFVLSISFSALIYTFSFAFLTLSVWLVGTRVLGHPAAPGTVARAVGLGYAPYLFSFFSLVPYFGNLIGLLLGVWSLLAVNQGVQLALNLPPDQALLSTFLGWLLLQLAQRTVGRPLVAGVRWLRRRIAGAPLATSREELRELFSLPQRPNTQLGRKRP